jgi:anhydro-N-acetylmuramic acid kinase
MVSRALLQYALRKTAVGRQTRSTGRELYGAKLAAELIERGRNLRLTKNDILATGLELTVERVRRHLLPIVRRDRTIDKLYLTGGGIHNNFLTERLRQELAPCDVAGVAELGFDPDLVEASAYAVMGEACLRSRALPTRFHGKRESLEPVLGKIAQPPKRWSRS